MPHVHIAIGDSESLERASREYRKLGWSVSGSTGEAGAIAFLDDWQEHRGNEPVALLVRAWLDDGLGTSLVWDVTSNPARKHVITGALWGPYPDAMEQAGADVIQYDPGFAEKIEPELRAALEERGRSPSPREPRLR